MNKRDPSEPGHPDNPRSSYDLQPDTLYQSITKLGEEINHIMPKPYISKESITRNRKGLITQVVFTLSDGTEITGEPLEYAGWTQWEAETDKLWITAPRLDELNTEMDHEETS